MLVRKHLISVTGNTRINTQKHIINIYLDCKQTSFLSKNTTNEYLEKGYKILPLRDILCKNQNKNYPVLTRRHLIYSGQHEEYKKIMLEKSKSSVARKLTPCLGGGGGVQLSLIPVNLGAFIPYP